MVVASLYVSAPAAVAFTSKKHRDRPTKKTTKNTKKLPGKLRAPIQALPKPLHSLCSLWLRFSCRSIFEFVPFPGRPNPGREDNSILPSLLANLHLLGNQLARVHCRSWHSACKMNLVALVIHARER